MDIIATLNQIGLENIPDVVLLGIGGNDLLDGRRPVDETIASIHEIIDILQSGNESVSIFLEQIAPGRSDIMTEEVMTLLNQFNDEIIEVGNSRTTATSKVITINMAKDWSDDYMADEVHYNELGAKIVADRYFEAMKNNLNQ